MSILNMIKRYTTWRRFKSKVSRLCLNEWSSYGTQRTLFNFKKYLLQRLKTVQFLQVCLFTRTKHNEFKETVYSLQDKLNLPILNEWFFPTNFWKSFCLFLNCKKEFIEEKLLSKKTIWLNNNLIKQTIYWTIIHWENEQNRWKINDKRK